MVEVFTQEMFNDFLNLCIFSLFVIPIINCLISDDGGFVYCRVISEMQHALETRLSFYKWKYEYSLNLCDHMVMMKAILLKVECSNKISLVPRAINFFHLANKKCLGYIRGPLWG